MSGHDGQNSSSTTQDGLDLSPFKEMAKTRLIAALNSVNGAKTLVLDASLAGPLGLITEVSLLKHHGVDKMFWLEAGPLTSTTTNIVYLCRPLIKHVKVIADQIKRHAKESQVHNYTVFLVPRVSTLVSHILEEEGVLGDVTLAPYELQFIPIADDVLSLEHDAAFKELWVDGDETIIFDSAQALHTLQLMYGLFPRIVGKGDYAYRLSTLLTRNVPKTANASTPELLLAPSSNIDSLIILDRRVDMITPLLTQLTYEGLIDELIGIKNSHVELPVTLASPPQNNTTQPAGGQPVAGPSSAPPPPAATLRKENKKKHLLTATTDPLYAEIRDLNFSVIGKRLNQVARRLDEDYKTRLQAETVAQLKDFVGKLGGLQSEHQSLRLHTGLSELLVPMTRTDHFNRSLEIQQNLLASYEVSAQISAVEEMIAQEADMQTVIRLLCLASIIAGGIKAKVLENLKREILQSYGYTCLPMLLSLAAPPLAVLLPNPLPPTTPVTVANTKLPFSSVRKSLRLLIDDDPQALGEVDNDISFVYSGYAPISVRLVQCVAQKGGVLSNPAEREKSRTEDATNNGLGKVQAHLISGWKGFEDVLAAIPGKTFDIVQKPPRGAGPDVPSKAPRQSFSKNHVTTTVVFFLGGCTYTEIAALRWVGRQNRGRKFLIATTGMVSGSGLVNSIAGLGSTPTSRDAGL